MLRQPEDHQVAPRVLHELRQRQVPRSGFGSPGRRKIHCSSSGEGEQERECECGWASIVPGQVGRVDINHPTVTGHKSQVMDLAWNPFNDNEIASASEDCTIKLWEIPDGGLKEQMTDPSLTLDKHSKKVGQPLLPLWSNCALFV